MLLASERRDDRALRLSDYLMSGSSPANRAPPAGIREEEKSTRRTTGARPRSFG
jgi:hypothetical protein